MRQIPAMLFHDQLANAVVRAVADVDVSPRIDKDAVRALQSAAPGTDLGTVPGGTVAHERLDGPTFRADYSDGMVFGVGNVDVAPRSHGDSLGTRERRHLRRSSVAGIALLSRPGQV